jgi:hypothetical protein
MALVCLGIAACIGCSDSSPRSWEESKSEPSGQKKSPRLNIPADNDDASTGDPSDNPHGMIDPHGAMNPHGDMPMSGGDADTKLENGQLDLDPVHFTVPKSWIPKPHSQMPGMQAEFAIPHAEGDKEDGRLTVSHFGGTLEDNLARWKKQFGDKPETQNEETLDAGGIKILLIDFAGTFSESRGPMMMAGKSVSHPDYRMLGAVFQVPGDTFHYFIKCYGPKKTITDQADEIKKFLRSLKVDK